MDDRLQAELARPHFIEVGLHALPSDLESYLNQIKIEDRRAASAYVFRILASQLDYLRGGDAQLAVSELLRKASDIPLFTLSIAGEHQVHRIEATGISRLENAAEQRALEHLRTLDLRGVVSDADGLCLIRAAPFEHFIAPSGEHCETFFRLGDAIRSRDALDRIVFWTSPLLVSAGGVIVDNWSIASLALRVFQLADQKRTPFDCLASHPQRDRRGAEVIISRMVKELDPNSNLLFLVSVTSSGSYADVVREIASKYLPEERIKVIAMYGLAGTPANIDRLCTLDFAPKNVHPEECDLCKSGKNRAIPLDPGLYYLKAYPERPVILGKDHFAQRGFIDRYCSVPGVFIVHRDDRLRRHHAFHVDVRAMLEGVPEFKSKFLDELSKFSGSVDLLITPADDVSELGELAMQQLGVPRIAADSLRSLSVFDFALLDRARRVLIVDDVLISGSRIEGYVKALREQTNKPEAVHILVGLGRPPSPHALPLHRNAWTKNVPWEANLIVLEEFILPDWAVEECPWCDELAILSRAAEGAAEPPAWLMDRISRLTEREQQGMGEDPLLLLPGVIERNLGHGSLVAPEGTCPMGSLFSVASALQFLRNDSRAGHKLEAEFPLYQVMAARNLKNYSESLLRAIILRAVAPKEWGVAEQQSLQKLLVSICRGGGDADLLFGEIMVATSRGALDRSAISTLGPLFEERHPGSDALLRVLTESNPREGEEASRTQETEGRQPRRRQSLPYLVVLVLLVVASLLWALR